MRVSVVAFTAVLLVASPVRADDRILEARGDPGDFGWAVLGVHDVDDDGYPDFLVGAGSAADGGAAFVRSGRTGAEIVKLVGPRVDTSNFGYHLFDIGDVDGDDVDDYLLPAIGFGRVGSPPGYAVVFSGATWTALYEVDGLSTSGYFGSAAVSIGDVDGDKIPDFVVGEPGAGAGRVLGFSGKSGAAIPALQIDDTNGSGKFGEALAALGDVDGDGVPDFAVGASEFKDGKGNLIGKIEIVSGADGTRSKPILGRVRRLANGAKIGEFLGYTLLGADVDGDGVRDLVAGGRVGGGFLTVLGLRGKKPTVIATLQKPASATSFAGEIRPFPDVDGVPGSEILVEAGNSVQVYSFGGATPRLVAQYDGETDEYIGTAIAAAGDLGSSDKLHRDGLPDVLLGSSALGRVRVEALTAPPVVLPKKSKQSVVFLPAGAAIGTKASGKLKATIKKGSASFSFGFTKLPGTAPYTLALETSPGASQFAEVGQLASSKGKIDLTAQGGLPAQLGANTLADLGGRIVELRDGTGALILNALLPSTNAPPKVKATLPFLTDPQGPFPGAAATAKLNANVKTGASSLLFQVKGAPKSAPFELWGETAAGTGNLVKFADLQSGSLKLDANSFIGFPVPVVDFATLMRRLLQIRSGNAVVATFEVSAAAPYSPLPDFWVRRARVDQGPPPVQEDFSVSVNVKNAGAADAGRVNLLAEFTFRYGDGGTRTASAQLRTSETFPAGQRYDGVFVGFVTNPRTGFVPGQIDVTVTVDPTGAGGSGEYLEEREDNNVATVSYARNLNTLEYDRTGETPPPGGD